MCASIFLEKEKFIETRNRNEEMEIREKYKKMINKISKKYKMKKSAKEEKWINGWENNYVSKPYTRIMGRELLIC